MKGLSQHIPNQISIFAIGSTLNIHSQKVEIGPEFLVKVSVNEGKKSQFFTSPSSKHWQII